MSQLAATRTVLISELATAIGADTLTAKEGSPLYDFIQRTAEAIVAQSVENAALRAGSLDEGQERISQLEDQIAALQKRHDELTHELANANRWEIGFRNIVTRIHGARKEFDIPDIVEKVTAIAAERDDFRKKYEAILAACKPVCEWWVKFKNRYPQFSYGDIDASVFGQRSITVSATDLDELSKLALPAEELRGTGVVKHEPGCNHFLPSGKCDCGALG
jgi:hypothetical protein